MGILSLSLTCLLPGLIVCLLAYKLSRDAGRINLQLLVILGLVTLGLYALPFPLSSDSLGDASPIALFFTSLLLLPALAWFSAAMLLGTNLLPGVNSKNSASEEIKKQPATGWARNRYIVTSLILSAALLLVSLHHLFWIFAWDATSDSIGVILLIPVMWIALGAALLLVLLLWRQRRVLGMTASVLFLAAVTVITQIAMHINFRQVTEERVRQVSQALERHFDALAGYPHELAELEPWYMWSVPVPMIIYDMDWCYEGGGNYFHLGYVTREHWSSPELIIRSYSSAGKDPDGLLDCSAQLMVLEARIPGLYSVIEDPDY
ncbi:MAG: hypothetical protein A2Z16_03690 [Chloroflexi bacterium RBG_16_54_18]|nr:MAG: hypothetical protein A2Z16_03690 [Chloroflexi bacterium RBG_16_54_18]